MVHRLDKLVPEAWIRAGRTLLQNVLSVAAVAVGPALVTAAQGGTTDLTALGLAGGQAALAAALAYGHNRVRPANGAQLSEVRFRAGRTLLQNLVAAAIVPGAYAFATAGGDDLKTLAMAGGQAALAGVIALAHNWISPRKAESAEQEVEGAGEASTGGAEAGPAAGPGAGYGGWSEPGSGGDGYGGR
ncbi:hypothetical protein [Nonomuraea sp. NPDC003214]